MARSPKVRLNPLVKELMMDFFTPGHLVVIAVVAVVVLIGWKRLPEMSRSLGRSLRIFKTEMKAMDAEVRDAVTSAAVVGTGVPQAVDLQAPASDVGTGPADRIH